MDRFGKGIRTAPRDALLGEAVNEKQRGLAFGWHRAMDTLGAAVGPLLAVYFLSEHSAAADLRYLYYLAVIPGIFSVVVALSLREKHRSEVPKVRSPRANFDFKWVGPDFKRYLIAWGMFALTNSSDVFLLLKAREQGLSLVTTILLYAFYNLLYAVTSPLLGHLSDKIGRRKILVLGLLVFAIIYVSFGFANEPWHFWALFGIYGIYMAATDGVGKAYALDLIPSEKKATGLGLVGSVTGFATIIASSVAGLLWDSLGSRWTFYYGAVGALFAISILLSISKPEVSRRIMSKH